MIIIFLSLLLNIYAGDYSDPKFVETASALRCPMCTGLSVLDSDAGFSKQIKDEVKLQVNDGKTKDQILDFFVKRYGPWILREPPKTGFGLIAWVIPSSLLIFGPVFIWFFVWRRRRENKETPVRSAEVIVSEMNVELEKLRQQVKK